MGQVSPLEGGQEIVMWEEEKPQSPMGLLYGIEYWVVSLGFYYNRIYGKEASQKDNPHFISP